MKRILTYTHIQDKNSFIVWDNKLYTQDKEVVSEVNPLLFTGNSAQNSKGDLFIIGDRIRNSKISEIYPIGTHIFVALENGDTHEIDNL